MHLTSVHLLRLRLVLFVIQALLKLACNCVSGVIGVRFGGCERGFRPGLEAEQGALGNVRGV